MRDATSFAASKFAFMAGVARDAELPNIATRIAVVFAVNYMRGENDGAAWPSIRTICQDLGVRSESTVRAALTEMVARGHLKAERRLGATTRFFISNPAEKFGGDPAEKLPVVQKSTPPKNTAGTPAKITAGTPSKNSATKSVERNQDKKPVYESLSPRLLDLDGETPRKEHLKASSNEAEEKFQRFWRQYPRRVGKGAARRAWDSAIKAGADPLAITAAAMRFAAQRERDEPDPAKREKFTPHPSSWLIGRRWEDEPTPIADAGPSGERRDQRPSVYELAFRREVL